MELQEESQIEGLVGNYVRQLRRKWCGTARVESAWCYELVTQPREKCQMARLLSSIFATLSVDRALRVVQCTLSKRRVSNFGRIESALLYEPVDLTQEMKQSALCQVRKCQES